MKILPNGFVGRVYPSDRAGNLEDGVFMSATYTDKGMLLLGGCLSGNVLGKDGEGLLAKFTFGYLSEEYGPAQIALAINHTKQNCLPLTQTLYHLWYSLAKT